DNKSTSTAASSQVTAVAAQTGNPLDQQTRDFMEPRFGFDFGRVRIHTDAGAADAAHSISARAYTLGNDVVFGSGNYSPGRTDGQRLIAHEPAQVVQQRSGMPRLSRQAGAPAPAAAPPQGNGAQQMPPDSTSHKDLEELEKKSFDAAKGRSGQ